ncbi:Mevalonate kinase protein [Marine Group I thaumarchaeote SCGC AAA799-B03]|uniref:Mevalonate kinase protein n=1 Tax=Marine Group I thaumarchaeote SCGC AAA799-B03 TaxID=1502289 RepID=A0A087S8U8_9ARCH|nr:Mevalonate kinase protein [Marine Group I thaumarchaeote SCGC AAA799-B03]
MKNLLIGLSPVRLSFAGGGTDQPEFYEKFGGNVITTSIDKFTYTIIHPRFDNLFQAFSPDFQKYYTASNYEKIVIRDGTEIASSVIKSMKFKKGINVILCSDVPAGSGLGASSSLAVNLVNVISYLKHEKLSESQIAEKAFHIGRKILHWPIGKQDEYISSFGGFNYIKFKKEKVSVVPIKMSKNTQKELEQSLLLFREGNTRNSSKILTKQIQMIKNRNPDTLNSLLNVKDLAKNMYASLKQSDITKFGELLHQGWVAKKKFTKNVSNSRIDKIYDLALKNGALGGKITGAGGGGHMLFYCELSKQKKLEKKLHTLGLERVQFSFYDDGPKIVQTPDMSNF